MTLAFLDYTPIAEIRIGALAISPHGIGTGVGFLAGARLMQPAARASGIDETSLWRLLTRALVGALVGARFAYVLNHLGDYTDRPLEVLRIWEGGASLLGGITAGILVALPEMRRQRLDFWAVMDAAAPGLALGIAIGRVGDLVVADHLGKQTDLFLGYRCTGADTASPCAAAIGQAVHQPALYDLVSVLALLGFLLWLRRRPLATGTLFLAFAVWYGTGRIVEDFFRIDETHGLFLTASQWAASAMVVAGAVLLLTARRPGRAPGALYETCLPPLRRTRRQRRGIPADLRNCALNGSDATGGSMPEEFEGDLAGAVFWGADLSGARFRDVNLTDAKISHAWLVNVDIDALVDTVVINGVDVTAYVNERDPWYPLRAMLRPSTPEGMRETWAALEDEWAKTVTRAHALPEDALHESVDDEWSFVQTLRHLVFAMDKWFTAPILGDSFHPIGLPNSGSVDFPWPGLDYGLKPTVSEALAVRADRATRFRDYLASVAPTDFARPIDVLENGTNPLEECIDTVFEEEFWHNRYAQRDLAQLEAANHDPA